MISLLLHLLILLLFTVNFKEMTFLPPPKQEKKMTLNLKQIVTPPPTPKPVAPKPKPKPIVKAPVQQPESIVKKVMPPTPKPETIKKKIVTESKKTLAVKSPEDNNITKVEPKPIEKKLVKKEVKKKPEKKIVEKKKIQPKTVTKKRVVKKKSPKRSNDALASALMGSATYMFPQQSQSTASSASGAYGEQMIKKLYGSEFNTYNQTQKKFIRNNLGTIHRITQHTLNMNGYPEIAVRTRQQGTNIVSFYLHPNGDISGLRLKRSLGYEALDSNTLEVIRTAYKDYPLPNKKTKIIFHVQYSIY